jgi:hypothetical protein
MTWKRWLGAGWQAASDADTALSWLARLGLLKIVIPLASAGATLAIGFLAGFRWPFVLLGAFGVALAALWFWNGLLYRSNQRQLRDLIQSGTLHSGAPETPKPEASPHELEQPAIRRRLFWIADLVRATDKAPIIHDRTFEDCDIYGPAVIAPLMGTTLTGNSLSASSADEAFIELSPGREIYGVIGLERCSVRGCRLFKMSLAGDQESVARMRKGFSDSAS